MEGILTEKQIKKRIANEKYRAKNKDNSQSTKSQSGNGSITDKDEIREEITTGEPEIPAEVSGEYALSDTPEEETYLLDKKSYLFLLEKARQNEKVEEPIKETPKEIAKIEPIQTSNEPSFFFLIKNQFKNTAISLLPILTLQLTMIGGKYIMNSRPNSTSTQSTTHTQNQQRNSHQQSTQDFSLPNINSL
jgi:hypothetical protein